MAVTDAEFVHTNLVARGFAVQASTRAAGRPGVRSHLRIGAAVLLLHAGCAAPPPQWPLERAQQLRSEGKLESALRLTEQELQSRYEDPAPELVELHVEILRDMDRAAEAEAFREFAARHASGIDTYEVTSGLDWKDCRKSQPGSELILEWGDPSDFPFPYTVDTLAATFEIDSEGQIGDITVVRARHPGEAWLLIRSLGTAKVSQWRLAERNRREPASFPVPLCVWWSFRTAIHPDSSSWP